MDLTRFWYWLINKTPPEVILHAQQRRIWALQQAYYELYEQHRVILAKTQYIPQYTKAQTLTFERFFIKEVEPLPKNRKEALEPALKASQQVVSVYASALEQLSAHVKKSHGEQKKPEAEPVKENNVFVEKEPIVERKKPLFAPQETLTTAEQQILAVMVALDKPVTYRELSQECKRSVSTIKTHLFNARRKGVRIVETELPDGVKTFSLEAKVPV